MSVWTVGAVDKIAQENYPKTIESPISKERRDRLPKSLYIPAGDIYAWGTPAKQANTKVHDAMKPGDICFFYFVSEDTKDKRYVWAAVVEQVIPYECYGEVSMAFWDVPNFFPYLLSKPIKINITTEDFGHCLNSSGEYKTTHAQGTQPLRDLSRAPLVSERYNGFDDWAREFLKQYSDEEHYYPEQIETEDPPEHSQGYFEIQAGLFHPSNNNTTAQSERNRFSKSLYSPKELGDKGESLIFRLLKDSLPTNSKLRWVSMEGEKPGWDIEYYDEHGQLIAVEVKATTAKEFSSFELTKNELAMARELGNRYHLYFVANIFADMVSYSVVKNPAEVFKERIKPIRYRIG